MSSPAIHETSPSAAAATDISPNVPKDVCDWFRSFYTTNAMIRSGCTVRTAIHDRAFRQGARPIKFGDLYDYDAAVDERNCNLDDFHEGAEESKEQSEDGQVNESDLDAPAPEPLTAAAYSMLDGPLDQFEKMEQTEQFDNDTLRRIVINFRPNDTRLTAIDDGDQGTRAGLILATGEVIHGEYESCEPILECHPVMRLMGGILCVDNSKWLSDADLHKMSLAHGGDDSIVDREQQTRIILASQVSLLQEMVDGGHMSDCRGYCHIRGLLADNKETLGLPIDTTELPSFSSQQLDSLLKRKALALYEKKEIDTEASLSKRRKVMVDTE